MGFEASQLHAGVYYHAHKQVMLVAHVDDLLCGGYSECLDWVRAELHKRYDIKRMIIREINEEIKFLGRRVRHTEDGYEWSADPKHKDILLDEWNMKESNSVAVPTISEDKSTEEMNPMTLADAKKFRRAAARLNYMALDRPDLAVAANLLSRSMVQPREGDDKKLKRVLRYLQGQPECVLLFPWQENPTELVVTTDSDWAGCKRTRRSTSGILLRHGTHVLLFASRFQRNVALSSGEAELTAQVGGLTDSLGVQNLAQKWGCVLGLRSQCDSRAARGVLQRTGVGKLRHLEVKHLWVQDLVREGRVDVGWIPRHMNVADLLTHACTVQDFKKHLADLGVEIRS